MMSPDTLTSVQPARHEKILAGLKNIINELTGIEPDAIDDHATYFEMGVSSLLLIQASQAIEERFGVRLALAQFFDELKTLSIMASYLDQQMLPEESATDASQITHTPEDEAHTVFEGVTPQLSYPQPEDSGRAAAVSHEAHRASSGGMVGNTTGASSHAKKLERIISQQLEIMSRQLEMLRQARPAATGIRASGVSETASVPQSYEGRTGEGAKAFMPPTQQPITESANSSAHVSARLTPQQAASKNCATESPEVFIPFQQTEAASAADLSLTQQQHLDQLIARYTARTRRSKELTQHYRSVHADPRAASGFRRLWKEMLYPIIAERSHGSRLWDIDGNQYVDLTMGFGVHMFGHSPDFIRDALEEQLRVGAHLGPQSALAGQVAELISELTGVERVTFCNSGAEAVMSALRVARSVTGRSLVAFFTGSYHGAFDGVLARSVMSKGARRAVAMAPGVMGGMIEDVLVLDYGSAESLEIIDARRHELAAVLVEPVQSRRPDFQPRAYLQEMRRMTQAGGAALILDEVVTGFRIHPGGCQAVFDVRADMVTYGKVIGGGMPIGVIAGKAAYLDAIDGGTWRFGDASYPAAGKTFFAGTFCKHPLAMAAARAALLHMKKEGPGLQEGLNRRAGEMAKRLNGYFEGAGIGMRVNAFGSLLTFALARDMRYGELLTYHMVEKGVYVWEGNTRYLSTAHTEEDIEYIVEAVKESVEELREGGFIAGERRERGNAPRLSAPPPMNFLHSSTGEGSKAPGVS